MATHPIACKYCPALKCSLPWRFASSDIAATPPRRVLALSSTFSEHTVSFSSVAKSAFRKDNCFGHRKNPLNKSQKQPQPNFWFSSFRPFWPLTNRTKTPGCESFIDSPRGPEHTDAGVFRHHTQRKSCSSWPIMATATFNSALSPNPIATAGMPEKIAWFMSKTPRWWNRHDAH